MSKNNLKSRYHINNKMPTDKSTLQMMRLFQDNFKKVRSLMPIGEEKLEHFKLLPIKDIMSTNLLIQLVEKKLKECDLRLAALRQTTQTLNSDFSAFDRKLNKVERWLHQRPTTDDNDSILADEDEETSINDDDDERRDEDEKNQQLIQLVLNTDGFAAYHGYEDMDSSYLNVTIRADGTTAFRHPISYWSNDRSSLVSSNSDIDASLASSSFSSGYSTS